MNNKVRWLNIKEILESMEKKISNAYITTGKWPRKDRRKRKDSLMRNWAWKIVGRVFEAKFKIFKKRKKNDSNCVQQFEWTKRLDTKE